MSQTGTHNLPLPSSSNGTSSSATAIERALEGLFIPGTRRRQPSGKMGFTPSQIKILEGFLEAYNDANGPGRDVITTNAIKQITETFTKDLVKPLSAQQEACIRSVRGTVATSAKYRANLLEK